MLRIIAHVVFKVGLLTERLTEVKLRPYKIKRCLLISAHFRKVVQVGVCTLRIVSWPSMLLLDRQSANDLPRSDARMLVDDCSDIGPGSHIPQPFTSTNKLVARDLIIRIGLAGMALFADHHMISVSPSSMAARRSAREYPLGNICSVVPSSVAISSHDKSWRRRSHRITSSSDNLFRNSSTKSRLRIVAAGPESRAGGSNAPRLTSRRLRTFSRTLLRAMLSSRPKRRPGVSNSYRPATTPSKKLAKTDWQMSTESHIGRT